MRWTYFIEGTQVYPMNTRELKVKDTLTDDVLYAYRKTLSSDIILQNRTDLNTTCYDLIKNLESTRRYDKFTLQVYDNSVLNSTYEFTINDIDFDDFKKNVKIKVTPRDIYTILQEKEDLEFNIIGISQNVTADIYSYIVIELKTRDDVHPITNSPDETAVDETYRKLIYTYCPVEGEENYIYWAIYATELLIVPNTDIFNPATNGFDATPYVTLDEYKIYRRFPTNFNVSIALYDTQATLPVSSLIELVWDIHGGNPQSSDDWLITELIPSYAFHTWHQDEGYYKEELFKKSTIYIRKSYYNGRFDDIYERTYPAYSLRNVFTDLISNITEFTGSVKSTFLFGDTPEPGHASITGFSDDLYLIDINDFKKPDAYEKTTIAKTTFKKMTDYFCQKFDCRWFIDGNDDFRIEHISYCEPTLQLDISSGDLARKYSYIKDNKPNREYLSEGKSYNEDFGSIEVLYGTVPAIEGTKESTKSTSLSDFYTDIDALSQHIDELPDEGFMVVQANTGAVVAGTGFKSGETSLQNVNLSNANVLNDFHRYLAYQKYYYIGGIAVTAKSIKKMKVQELYFQTVPDTTKLLVTKIGVGKITELDTQLVEENNFKAEVIYE